MARPRKNNADYFSHDNDLRNDDRIKAARRRFGMNGYGIWLMMLEKLCKAKNFTLEWNEVNHEMWSGDFEIDPDILKEIIEYFIKIGLLQEELSPSITNDNDDYRYRKYNELSSAETCREAVFSPRKLFCKGLIDRFEGLLTKRERDRKSKEKVVIDKENEDKKELPSTKTTNKKVFGGESTQSKVKEIKNDNNNTKVLNITKARARDIDVLLSSFSEHFPENSGELSSATLKKLLETNSVEKIQEAITDIANLKKEKPIKSPAGYLVKALSQDRENGGGFQIPKILPEPPDTHGAWYEVMKCLKAKEKNPEFSHPIITQIVNYLEWDQIVKMGATLKPVFSHSYGQARSDWVNKHRGGKV